MRSVRNVPVLRPQGRGGQGAADADAARRLQAAARTLRAARSAMFAGGLAAPLQGSRAGGGGPGAAPDPRRLEAGAWTRRGGA